MYCQKKSLVISCHTVFFQCIVHNATFKRTKSTNLFHNNFIGQKKLHLIFSPKTHKHCATQHCCIILSINTLNVLKMGYQM